MRLTWMYHVVHNKGTMHGRNIKTRYIGSTSILRFKKMLIYQTRSNVIILQGTLPAYCIQLLDWRLEKCYTKKLTCHLDHNERSHWNMTVKENWVRKLLNDQKGNLLDNQKEKLLHKQNFSNQPNQLLNQLVIDQCDLITYKMEGIRPVPKWSMLILFYEELCSSDRTVRLVEMEEFQTRSVRVSMLSRLMKERGDLLLLSIRLKRKTGFEYVLLKKTICSTLTMKYFAKEWKNSLLVMTRVMNQFGERTRHGLPNSRTTTFRCEIRAKYQRSTVDSENWEPPSSTCSSARSATESII